MAATDPNSLTNDLSGHDDKEHRAIPAAAIDRVRPTPCRYPFQPSRRCDFVAYAAIPNAHYSVLIFGARGSNDSIVNRGAREQYGSFPVMVLAEIMTPSWSVVRTLKMCHSYFMVLCSFWVSPLPSGVCV